jgi:hypothetical protein
VQTVKESIKIRTASQTIFNTNWNGHIMKLRFAVVFLVICLFTVAECQKRRKPGRDGSKERGGRRPGPKRPGRGKISESSESSESNEKDLKSCEKFCERAKLCEGRNRPKKLCKVLERLRGSNFNQQNCDCNKVTLNIFK